MNRPAKTRSDTELEEIQAEGHDWFADGYDFASEYIQAWKEGKIALGKPIEQQPESAFANRLWRQGFNKRVHEHMMQTLSRQGLASGQPEIQRWSAGIANALGQGDHELGG